MLTPSMLKLISVRSVAFGFFFCFFNCEVLERSKEENDCYRGRVEGVTDMEILSMIWMDSQELKKIYI